jgi:hypothetical protein
MVKPLDTWWPEPQNISINMMPYSVGIYTSIPLKYRHYWEIIKKLSFHCKNGDTAYLTINESWVEPDTTQRRPGIHTESPGMMKISNKIEERYWGRGAKKPYSTSYVGGICMTSNITDSCWVWPCQLQNMNEIVPAGGDIDHLREFLGKPEAMKESEIWWITDGTPHESRPVSQRVYRQFVRVVGPELSVWFKDHSTENELGIQPEAEIICGNKFEMKEDDEVT